MPEEGGRASKIPRPRDVPLTGPGGRAIRGSGVGPRAETPRPDSSQEQEGRCRLPERILIVKLSALGDTALALPLLAALRSQLPDAFIGWAVGERASPLLEHFPEIDRLHVWRRRDRSAAGLWRFAREIRAARYDVSIDAQCLTKSAIIPFLARIPRRIGAARYSFGGREITPILNNQLVRPPAGMEYAAAQTLCLGTALGLDMPEEMPVKMAIPEEARSRQRRWWRENGLTDSTIVFGVGSTRPTKIWAPERVAALATAAIKKGWRCVLLLGPAERKELARWRPLLDAGVLLTPPTSMQDMVALLELGERHVGPDSAALHIAALLGRATFSWFGSSGPARCAPRGSAHRYVTKGLPCQPCWKGRCRSVECLRDLSVEEVMPAFTEWLGG